MLDAAGVTVTVDKALFTVKLSAADDEAV